MNDTQSHDLIIFDCDGVLVDSESLACRAVVDCLCRHGIEMDADTVFDKLLGRGPGAIGEYCALLGRSVPEGFRAELRATTRAAFAVALKPIHGVAGVLENLRTPYCVASSSDLERMDYSLRLTGLSTLVDGRLFSAEMVRHGKPAPDLFLHAAARMGTAPDCVLVIEDSVSGVQAGKAAGMTVWGFVGGSHYAARPGRALLMAAGADLVFDRMADFHRLETGLLDSAVR